METGPTALLLGLVVRARELAGQDALQELLSDGRRVWW